MIGTVSVSYYDKNRIGPDSPASSLTKSAGDMPAQVLFGIETPVQDYSAPIVLHRSTVSRSFLQKRAPVL